MARYMADLQVYYACGQESLARYYVRAYRLEGMVQHWRDTLQRRGKLALRYNNPTAAFTVWALGEWLGEVKD